MEIGSFIELQMPKGGEFYAPGRFGDMKIARLNSGRAAIWHAFRVTCCDVIWLPYYQCDTVREFLRRKGARIKYYHIDSAFNPVELKPAGNEAVLLVNYYGIMSYDRMRLLSQNYDNVIIDNSQAFFSSPVEGCQNVYSARKFIGVSDGAYVVGRDADRFSDEYPQGFSSDTSLFLLQRIEYGCEGKAYESRKANEQRIDSEDIMRMSALTHYILDGTEYESIKMKRRENFETASTYFGKINKISPYMHYDDSCVPMIYPLVVEDDALLERLLGAKHFQGHWWSYLEDELDKESFEYWLSRFIVPITIDQRYGKPELDYLQNIIV